MRTSSALFLLLLGTLACTVVPSHEYEIADGWHGPQRIVSAFLAPMNATGNIAEELTPGADRTIDALRRHLESNGITIRSAPLFRFRNAWTRSFEGVAIEPGSTVPPEAFAALFQRLRQHDDFDVLVVPLLEFRPARINGVIVRWDGVRRTLIDEGIYRGLGSWQGVRPDIAVSLRVRVFEESGQQVFNGVGGLDVVFKIGELYENEIVEDPLSDLENLSQGVRIALDPFIPYSDE